MNQMFSPESIIPSGNPSWPTTLGYVDKISKQNETHKILNCLWEFLQRTGRSGYTYYLSHNATDCLNTAPEKVFYFGDATGQHFEIYDRHETRADKMHSAIEVIPANDNHGSIIICPVFGPFISKGTFIISCESAPDQLPADELEMVNYILQKSQIQIAEIEAKRKLETISLSNREIQVLGLLIKGASNKDVASKLGVSVHTVNGYVRLLMLKMDVKDRVSACMVGLSILQ